MKLAMAVLLMCGAAFGQVLQPPVGGGAGSLATLQNNAGTVVPIVGGFSVLRLENGTGTTASIVDRGSRVAGFSINVDTTSFLTLAGVQTIGNKTLDSSNILGGVNAQTGTTYTYLNGDNLKLVTHTNAAAIAGTLPQANGSTFISGWNIGVQNRGAGSLTITPTTSTIDGASALVLSTNQGARIFSDGTNYYTQRGIGGGSLTAGTSVVGGSPTSGGLLYTDGSGVLQSATDIIRGTGGVLNISAMGTGSAAALSIGAVNTGLYSASGQLAFIQGGTLKLYFDNSNRLVVPDTGGMQLLTNTSLLVFGGLGDAGLSWISAGVMGVTKGGGTANGRLNLAGATFLDPTASTGATRVTVSLGAADTSATTTLSNAGVMASTGGYSSGFATYLMTTTTALTAGGTGSAPTLTTGPVAGNPTKWVAINDNGTIRRFPTW